MKDLTNIIDETLGVDRILYAAYPLNDSTFTIYKEYQGDRVMLIKDYNTISPLFNNLIEADAWINNNS